MSFEALWLLTDGTTNCFDCIFLKKSKTIFCSESGVRPQPAKAAKWSPHNGLLYDIYLLGQSQKVKKAVIGIVDNHNTNNCMLCVKRTKTSTGIAVLHTAMLVTWILYFI